MKTRRVATIVLIVFLLSLAGMVYNVGAQEVSNAGVSEPTPPSPFKFNPGTELKYDDGSAEVGWAFGDIAISHEGRFAVQFTPPFTPALVTNAVFWILSSRTYKPLKLHVLDSSFTELITPPLVIDPVNGGWNNIDLASYGIVVTGDFYIALEWTYDGNPYLGMDTNGTIYDRSWIHLTSLTPEWQLMNVYVPSLPGNWLLRAVVEEVTPAVIPEYPLGTILGLVSCLAALVVFKSKPIKLLRRT